MRRPIAIHRVASGRAAVAGWSVLVSVMACSHASAVELETEDDVAWLCSYSDPTELVETGHVIHDTAISYAVPDQAPPDEADTVAYARERARILLDPHSVEVAADRFVLLPYNEELGLLSVPLSDGIQVWDDAWLHFPDDGFRHI